jgi:hypothetical protein
MPASYLKHDKPLNSIYGTAKEGNNLHENRKELALRSPQHPKHEKNPLILANSFDNRASSHLRDASLKKRYL